MNRLLTVTSLLDFITPSRCDALLEWHDSRAVLHRLEELGIIATDDDGATYRMPKVLRLYLLAGIDEMEPEEQAGLRQRTAALLEREGEVGEGLRILAEGGDWESETCGQCPHPLFGALEDYRGTRCLEISAAAFGRSIVPAATPTTRSKPSSVVKSCR